jgi:hypothetical protein
MAPVKSLQAQANEIMEQAEKKGVSTNFFFTTTFKRYQVQMKILTELEKQIDEEGPVCEKEYVKGRKNLYTNPAITEYNRTATAANGTVVTLIKIVEGFADEKSAAALDDRLSQFRLRATRTPSSNTTRLS